MNTQITPFLTLAEAITITDMTLDPLVIHDYNGVTENSENLQQKNQTRSN